MRSLIVLSALLASPAALGRISTVQELRYLSEVLTPIAIEGGFSLDPESLSVHGYSAQENEHYGFRRWNTPAGNQDHTIIFRARRGETEQMRTVYFMSEVTKLGRPCHLRNGTSRRITSAFDGREHCVSLYLRPRRGHLGRTPTMENMHAPRRLLWDVLGSKRP